MELYKQMKQNHNIKSLNSNVLLKVYGNKCESVADYIDLLNSSSAFVQYRDVRVHQYMDDNARYSSGNERVVVNY